MVFVLMWLAFAVITGYVAGRKGHSSGWWGLLGFLLGPFGLIFALALTSNTAVMEERAIASGEMKRCPGCAELIKSEAVVCRYCGSNVAAVQNPARAADDAYVDDFVRDFEAHHPRATPTGWDKQD